MYKKLIRGLVNPVGFMDYEAATACIEQIPQIGKEPGVVRSARLLKELGNPERKLKIIHVAGTNGKGSVCMYITRILCEMGYCVGTFVSPHLVRVNERILLQEEPVDDAVFTESFNRVWPLQEKTGPLGYFDVFLGIAMDIYSRKNVDYVVMETGLGGRLDGTNAVENPLLTVITSISLDHCALLGDTVEAIAAEKAGIIKPGIPVVWDAGRKEICHVIQKQARKCHAPSFPVEKSQWEIQKVEGNSIDFLMENRYYKKELFTLHTYGLYQVANAALALTAVNVLMPVPFSIADKALQNMRWKGRMEEVCPGFFVDGAHNPDGMVAFTASVAQMGDEDKRILLFSAVKDKNYEKMIEIICVSNLFDGFVVTQIEGTRKLGAEEILECFRKYTQKDVWVEPENNKAIMLAKKQAQGGRVFAAGSLYLAGKIEEVMCGFCAGKEENHD